MNEFFSQAITRWVSPMREADRRATVKMDRLQMELVKRVVGDALWYAPERPMFTDEEARALSKLHALLDLMTDK